MVSGILIPRPVDVTNNPLAPVRRFHVMLVVALFTCEHDRQRIALRLFEHRLVDLVRPLLDDIVLALRHRQNQRIRLNHRIFHRKPRRFKFAHHLLVVGLNQPGIPPAEYQHIIGRLLIHGPHDIPGGKSLIDHHPVLHRQRNPRKLAMVLSGENQQALQIVIVVNLIQDRLQTLEYRLILLATVLRLQPLLSLAHQIFQDYSILSTVGTRAMCVQNNTQTRPLLVLPKSVQ